MIPDTLKVYDILKDAQIPEPQARAITRALQESDQAVAFDLRAFMDERLDKYVTKDFLGARLGEMEAKLVRWMFAFWVGEMAALADIILASLKAWH